MHHRIAIIADIHANLFALEVAIDDLATRQIDEVIVAGDLVGRGPQGSEVIARIDELGWPCVRGNHEDYLLSFWHGDVPDSWMKDEQWAASRWMADELNAEAIEFMESLPFSRHCSLAPAIEVFHGSPNSHSEGIGAWTPQLRLEEHLKAIDGTVLVCAHTHRPLEYRSPNGLVVNVGSLGLPFNGDWRAQYAILEGSGADWKVSFVHVDYPRQKFLDYYETSGFLEEGRITAQLLYREVQAARPFLVPFLKWAELTDRRPTSEHLDEFLDVYEPDESMRDFFARLHTDSDRPPPGHND